MSGPNGQPVRILIAEDHAVVRQSVKVMLEMEPEFIVVGEAEDGEQALELAAKVDPDLVLMDIRMEAWMVLKRLAYCANDLRASGS